MLKVLANVQPKSLTIAAAVTNAATVLGLPHDMIITHGRDGKHKRGSKHYSDEALDFRTKHLAPAMKTRLIEVVQQRLGSRYQVLLEDLGTENEHGHAEFDPA